MAALDSLGELSVWDWGVIFLASSSTLVSIWRGFSREAISLIGWVIAFLIANSYAGTIAANFENIIDNVMARLVVSWMLVFLTVLLSAVFFARFFSKVVFFSGLSLLDRILGTVFGFARGVVIVAILVFLSREVSPVMFKEVASQSKLVRLTEMLVDWSLVIFESDIVDILAKEE